MKYREIKSRTNDKIKFLHMLNHKKYREESGKFLVENPVTIFSAPVGPEEMYITEEFFTKHKGQIEKFNCEIYLISPEINKYFSSLEAPQGIAAVFSQQSREADLSQNIIYLNNINDPGNLGTIMRSAVAFGLNNLILDETTADIYNPKTISAAKDAIFKINFSFDKGFKTLKGLKNKMPILATRLDGGKEINKFLDKKPFCLVLGNEANGVSPEVEKIANDFIKISMSDEMESLNVATAATVLFYLIYTS